MESDGGRRETDEGGRPDGDEEQPFIWSVRLDGDVGQLKPGAGAREQAHREAQGKALVRRVVERLTDAKTDERAWRRGAEGEEQVARRLERLSKDFTVVHDVPIGDRGANVDHVVVGPPGVYCLNTKHLTGRVWVGGRTFIHNNWRTDYIPKAEFEAKRVGKCLTEAVGVEVSVRPVIVVMGVEQFRVKRWPQSVDVITDGVVVPWLEQRPRRLESDHRERLARAIRLRSTWSGTGRAEIIDPIARQRFPSAEPLAIPPVGDVIVREWRRYGKHRLYVSSSSGGTVGYVDLATNAVVVDDEAHRHLVETAAANFLRASS